MADMPTLLLDHAQCERKAAANARSLATRYPENEAFVAAMESLAREEEEHLHAVRALLDQRGIAWQRAEKDAYVVHLLKEVRSPAPLRFLDRLLIAAIIEARSCERLGMLAEALPDPALRRFYRELFEAEARHHGLFLEWARHFGGRAPADERLAHLLTHEAAYVLAKTPTAHVHG